MPYGHRKATNPPQELPDRPPGRVDLAHWHAPNSLQKVTPATGRAAIAHCRTPTQMCMPIDGGRFSFLVRLDQWMPR